MPRPTARHLVRIVALSVYAPSTAGFGSFPDPRGRTDGCKVSGAFQKPPLTRSCQPMCYDTNLHRSPGCNCSFSNISHWGCDRIARYYNATIQDRCQCAPGFPADFKGGASKFGECPYLSGEQPQGRRRVAEQGQSTEALARDTLPELCERAKEKLSDPNSGWAMAVRNRSKRLSPPSPPSCACDELRNGASSSAPYLCQKKFPEAGKVVCMPAQGAATKPGCPSDHDVCVPVPEESVYEGSLAHATFKEKLCAQLPGMTDLNAFGLHTCENVGSEVACNAAFVTLNAEPFDAQVSKAGTERKVLPCVWVMGRVKGRETASCVDGGLYFGNSLAEVTAAAPTCPSACSDFEYSSGRIQLLRLPTGGWCSDVETKVKDRLGSKDFQQELRKQCPLYYYTRGKFQVRCVFSETDGGSHGRKIIRCIRGNKHIPHSSEGHINTGASRYNCGS
mmetsp:Transcript_13220/g.28530  ORF Transcript_13220/g.28530 Transcript_13220/m.28530 type:complete len:449 (-) Transcript_13220:449-1795(-)